MYGNELAAHLERPAGRGHTPPGALTGAAGGAACGDLIRISLTLEVNNPAGVINDIGFQASGCGTMIAAGSAIVSLVHGSTLLTAAQIGTKEISEELGGLSPAKLHAAELACDALHRALGWALKEQAQLQPSEKRVLVAMSGGVDSAVAALLSSQQGEETVGVTLELWSDPENDGEQSCCSAHAVRGARELAHSLGMPHFSIDLRSEFRAGVVDPWLNDHASGLTPNPCVRCNGNVRLDAMLELADRVGAAKLATGHYARKHTDARANGPLLGIASDPVKDQSYVLAALDPCSLERLSFPLGAMHKHQVRALAMNNGLAVASKRDSQDLCFLAGTKTERFLARHGSLHKHPGKIINPQGEELGEHGGHYGFTVGQRRGLGLAKGEPLYVLATDAEQNTVTVGSREDLLTSHMQVREVTLRADSVHIDAVKIRSRGRRIACRVRESLQAGPHQNLELELLEPLERTAPGQHACLFSGELIVGYGTIA